MNYRDRAALEAARPSRQVLSELPPFLDPDDWVLSGGTQGDSSSRDTPSKIQRGIPSPEWEKGRGDRRSREGGSASELNSVRSAALLGARSSILKPSHPHPRPVSHSGEGGTRASSSARIALPAGNSPEPLRLLTVAMMRDGDKLASYRLLVEALAQIGDHPWTLDVAGDGPAAAEVASLLAPFGDRVRRHGAVEPAALSTLYAAADLLVWPAVNEAYGMALLEAQAHGCPVVAGGYGGVPDVVRDGATGRVTPPGDAPALAAAIRDLAGAPDTLAAMGRAALAFAREERGLTTAAARLHAALGPLLREPA
ncbi:glycosyltransferase family 4 protein [Methylobacterium aquaticum]|nr:glycosyltransferase family 4 protein [Methylobacterium aquaticum]